MMKNNKTLRSCSIQSCRNFLGTSDAAFSFFRPPKEGPVRTEWIRVVKEHSQAINGHYQICNLHFRATQMERTTNGKVKLSPGAVPTNFDETNGNEIDPEQSLNIGSGNIHASTHHMYKQEFEKRLNLEIKLLRIQEQVSKLEVENDKLKSKNNELEVVLNSRDEKIRTLISELSDDDKSLFECLLGLKKKQINPVVRTFAITMQSFSTRAYGYLRRRFHDNLPHVNTIGHWHTNANFGERSGITKAAILQLKEISSEFKSRGKVLIGSLCFDETSMRKHLQWRDSDKRFLGFIDIGKRPEHKDWPISTQVLVFLLNGVNLEFSIPVAYYFITNLNSEEKKTVLLQVIEAVTNAGVKVMNITFDGLSTNFGMCQQLGASFDLANPKTYFINPADGSKIFIMLDACHMLKLLRNCIGTFDLRDGEERIISWKFFKSLETFRKKHDLVTHKMTKKHIEWEKNKMKVSLAAQTLSKSVADSMAYLKQQGIRCFQDCEGTVKFVRTVNSLFDIFNSSKEDNNDHFKAPLNHNSFRSISDFLTETIGYLSTLKINGKNIMTSKRKTGFKGFVINIHSLLDIWKELAIDEEITLRTYSLSQDPLESFFGRIRSSLGNNDNPTQEQFTAAYRRQLIPNEITSSQFANCKDNLRILQISSANRCSQEPSEDNIQNDGKKIEDLTSVPEFINRSISDIQATSIAHSASLIEKKIAATKFECEICERIFELDEKFEDNISESVFVPCKSSVEICKHTIKFIDILRTEHHLDYDILLEKILLSLNIDALFPNTNFSHDPYHKDWIVRFIVEDFFRMQAVYIARNLTLDSKKFVRSLYRKAIHRSNE